VIVPGYNGRWLHLTVHGDCALRAVTHVCVLTAILHAFCLLLPLGYVGGE